jgi:hypothetical protein
MLTVSTTRDRKVSVTRCNFADLADLLAGANVTPANQSHYAGKLDDITYLAGSSSYGGITGRDDAEKLMREGWADGAKQATVLTPKLSNVVTPVKSVRRRAAWGENGSELHLDRALSGDWDKAWRTTMRTAGVPKVLALGCNFGGHAGISHRQLFWCAAQMIVATDILESAGYAVELHALKCNDLHDADRHVFLDVTVKQPDQPMRADAVASVFGHAGVYRTFGHVLLMSSPFNIGSGYGRPIDVAATLKKTTAEGLTDSLDYVLEHAYDLDTAARNITKALTTLTGPANDE